MDRSTSEPGAAMDPAPSRRRPLLIILGLPALVIGVITLSALGYLDVFGPAEDPPEAAGSAGEDEAASEDLADEPGPAPDGSDRRWESAVSDDWPADAVIYHVFVDRFADGSQPDTQVAGTPDDPGYADALTDWMGGDLAGLRARLDHIVDSGANTIWLSPVTPGPYFHGYHPTDLTDVDPHFGDVDELRGLVADAHELGLRVVYDLVLNHTSDQHPWFVEAQADCDGSTYVQWYSFRECPDRYDAFAGLPELPELDLDHPEARAYMFDEVLPFWLDDIGVDGFRLDHVEGPSRDFWRAFDEQIDQRWPGTLVLGEVWSDQRTIDGYGEVLDAATAFPLRDRLLAVFARDGNMPAMSLAIAAGIDEDGAWRTTSPLPSTYLSSHDQPRFTYEADGDTRRTGLAYATLMTLPGVPAIYYGDEVGLSQSDSLPDGADFADRWFREPMPWDESAWDHELFETVSSFARWRTTTPSLHSGTYIEVEADGQRWVFDRIVDGSQVRVLVNGSDEPAELEDGDGTMLVGPRSVGVHGLAHDDG